MQRVVFNQKDGVVRSTIPREVDPDHEPTRDVVSLGRSLGEPVA